MTFDLGRRLLLSNAIHAGELRHAVYDAVQHARPFPRALADASATVRAMLVRAVDGGERAPLEEVVPNRELVRALPRGLPGRLLAVPVRRDPAGVVEVAVVDPLDRALAAELSYHFGGDVRLVAAPLEAIEAAVREATIELVDPSVEATPVPLVRRSGRTSLIPPAPVASLAQAMEMVLDFSASSREEREAPAAPVAVPLHRLKPRTLDVGAIERAADRDELLASILEALLSTARAAAIFAPRRGRWGGVAAAGAIDVERVRAASVPADGAIATAIARGDWCAPLEPAHDAALLDALDLASASRASTEVLVHPVYVAEKPAMLLVAFGMSDPSETSRRVVEVGKTTSRALLRMLRHR